MSKSSEQAARDLVDSFNRNVPKGDFERAREDARRIGGEETRETERRARSSRRTVRSPSQSSSQVQSLPAEQVSSPAPNISEPMSPAPTLQSKFQEQAQAQKQELTNFQKAQQSTTAFALSKADNVIRKGLDRVGVETVQGDTFEVRRKQFQDNPIQRGIDKGVQKTQDRIDRVKKGEGSFVDKAIVTSQGIINPVDFVSGGKVTRFGGEVVKDVFRDPVKLGATAVGGAVVGGALKVVGVISKPAVTAFKASTPSAPAMLEGLKIGTKTAVVGAVGILAGQDILSSEDRVERSAQVATSFAAFGVGAQVGSNLASGVKPSDFAVVGKKAAVRNPKVRAKQQRISKVVRQKQSRNQQFDPRKGFDDKSNQFFEKVRSPQLKNLGQKERVDRVGIDPKTGKLQKDVQFKPQRSDVFKGPDRTVPPRKQFRDPQGGSQSLKDVRDTAKNFQQVATVNDGKSKTFVVQQQQTKDLAGFKLDRVKRNPLPNPQGQTSDQRLILQPNKAKQLQTKPLGTQLEKPPKTEVRVDTDGRSRVREQIMANLKRRQLELKKQQADIISKAVQPKPSATPVPKKSDLLNVPKSKFETATKTQSTTSTQSFSASSSDKSLSEVLSQSTGLGVASKSRLDSALNQDSGLDSANQQRFINIQRPATDQEVSNIQTPAIDQSQRVAPVQDTTPVQDTVPVSPLTTIIRSRRTSPPSSPPPRSAPVSSPPSTPPVSSPPRPPLRPPIRTPPRTQPPRLPPIITFNKKDSPSQVSGRNFQLFLKPSARDPFQGTGITSSSLKDIVAKGVLKVGSTAKASFIVKDDKGKKVDAEELLRFAPSKKFTLSKSVKGALVEKPKFRISSPGELQEITFKGISKRRKRI